MVSLTYSKQRQSARARGRLVNNWMAHEANLAKGATTGRAERRHSASCVATPRLRCISTQLALTLLYRIFECCIEGALTTTSSVFDIQCYLQLIGGYLFSWDMQRIQCEKTLNNLETSGAVDEAIRRWRIYYKNTLIPRFLRRSTPVPRTSSNIWPF